MALAESVSISEAVGGDGLIVLIVQLTCLTPWRDVDLLPEEIVASGVSMVSARFIAELLRGADLGDRDLGWMIGLEESTDGVDLDQNITHLFSSQNFP